MRAKDEKFVDLESPRRVWAVAAVNGDIDRLMALHDHLATRFAARDRLVYLGNYAGASPNNSKAVFQELLAFRSALLAKQGMKTNDIVHLRGPAEEAWQRLLRLQFAPVPVQTLEKLCNYGVEVYLRLYGASLNDTISVARAGSVAITRWTNQLRVAQRMEEGHEAIVSSMRRAAVTRPNENGSERLLFVPACFDSSRSLEDQGDNLWYGSSSFHDPAANESHNYARIVRGFDANRDGINTENAAVTLDGGCGRGGPLVCGCFNASGRLAEIVAVGGQGAVESTQFEERARMAKTERRSVTRDDSRRIAASA